MTDQLEIYKQVILEHNKKPKNFSVMADANCKAEGYNPLCGDHLWIYAKISQGEQIEAISFSGSGCAISKASASMMTVALKDKTIAANSDMIDRFLKMLRGELSDPQELQALGKLSIFSNIWKYPSRVKCASLAWYTAKGAFEKALDPITTE